MNPEVERYLGMIAHAAAAEVLSRVATAAGRFHSFGLLQPLAPSPDELASIRDDLAKAIKLLARSGNPSRTAMIAELVPAYQSFGQQRPETGLCPVVQIPSELTHLPETLPRLKAYLMAEFFRQSHEWPRSRVQNQTANDESECSSTAIQWTPPRGVGEWGLVLDCNRATASKRLKKWKTEGRAHDLNARSWRIDRSLLSSEQLARVLSDHEKRSKRK